MLQFDSNKLDKIKQSYTYGSEGLNYANILDALTGNNETIHNAFEKHGKFFRDYMAIIKQAIIAVDTPELVNYMVIINVLNEGVTYHKSGKIEGVLSLDSSAHFCGFCDKARKAAETNPEMICGYCYDYAQETGYRAGAVLPRHWLNMFILSTFELPFELLSGLRVSGKFFRFNSSGDIDNWIHGLNLYKIALSFPSVQFGWWSKNRYVMEKLFDTYGKPENVRYVQSSILINKCANRSKYSDTVFTVYRADKIGGAISGGANVCNGQKCIECGFKCYRKAVEGGWNDGTETAELLRLK